MKQNWLTRLHWSYKLTLFGFLLLLVWFVTEGAIGIWAVYVAFALLGSCILYFSIVHGTTWLRGASAYYQDQTTIVCPECGKRTAGGKYCKYCGTHLKGHGSG